MTPTGVFPDSIKKLRYDSVPATNYDPETVEGWSLPTPEFVLWVKEVNVLLKRLDKSGQMG